MKPGQLSNTAAFIAIKFYGLTRSGPARTLFDDDVLTFYERLVASLPAPHRWYHPALKKGWLRGFFMFWEELLLPGDLMHILLRKYYLHRWIDQLHRQGYRQLLILGAGFDHLGSLQARRGLRAVELDTPRMMDIKQRVLSASGYDHPNLLLRKTFFTRDTLDMLLQENTNMDPGAKTIIVAEGFFDYFTQQNCDGLLDELNGFFKNDTALLSTIFDLEPLSAFRRFVYRSSIRMAGEQLRLGLSHPEYIALLQHHGFHMQVLVRPADMREHVLEPRNIPYPVLKGFFLTKTERKRAEIY